MMGLAAVAAVALGIAGAGPGPAKVAYPDGYRDWTHVKSMVLQPGHPLYEGFGGIHHIYANDKALRALRDGGAFPDGAVLVFDLLEAIEADAAISEGARKVVGVMERDAKRFSATGGWGFEGFKGDTRERVVTDAAGQCFACHESGAADDFVFSEYRR